VSWIPESKTRDVAELAIGYVLMVSQCGGATLSVLVHASLGDCYDHSSQAECTNARSSAFECVFSLDRSAPSATWRRLYLDRFWAAYPAWFFYWHPDGADTRIFSVVLAQQFMLQDYFLIRLLRLMPSKAAAVSTAAILFASAHIPNPVLMLATLLWGVAACILFLRFRDLYSLGVAHCFLGICIGVTVPAHIHHGMRVGLGYRQYRPRVERTHFNQMDQMVSTEAWVSADAVNRCSARQARP
jgi:hypothetical protein